jgi:putative transcriptional regulator
MGSLSGHLLIAGPDLWDPNFRRTIILIGQHDEDGAVGVVLNRVSDITVGEAAPGLADLVDPGEWLSIGGPVQPGAAVVLAELDDPAQADIPAIGPIGFVTGELSEEVAASIRRARVFAGYAGWGAGQLEAELAGSSWIVEPAQPGDVFTDPERLWDVVLRRKGPEFQMLALMPEDPSLN